MPFIGLLDGLQDALVYPEGDGDREEGQAHVGTHADDAAHRQGQQQQEAGAKHHARGLDITPVQELHHWNKGHGRRVSNITSGRSLRWVHQFQLRPWYWGGDVQLKT